MNHRVLFDARVIGNDGIGRVTQALLPQIIARAASYELDLAILTRGYLPKVEMSRQIVDRSLSYSTEELTAPATAVREFRADTFLSLDVKIGLIPPGPAVVSIVHDLMRLHYVGFCYDDAAVTARWGEARLSVMRKSVQRLRSSLNDFHGRGSSVHAQYCRLAALWMVRRADLLVAPSYTTLKDILAINEVPRRHPCVVRWGLDHVSHRTGRIRSSIRYLVYVGQDRPHKNVATLLAAFATLREIYQDIELWLVGRDFVSSSRRQNDRIRRLGPVNDEELAKIVSNAALFVQPSLQEGFGFGPFEALLNGTPVLLGPAPVFVEHFKSFSLRDVGWAQNGLAGEIVSETCRLLNQSNTDECTERAARARARLNCLTWADCADKLLSLVGNLRDKKQ